MDRAWDRPENAIDSSDQDQPIWPETAGQERQDLLGGEYGAALLFIEGYVAIDKGDQPVSQRLLDRVDGQREQLPTTTPGRGGRLQRPDGHPG